MVKKKPSKGYKNTNKSSDVFGFDYDRETPLSLNGSDYSSELGFPYISNELVNDFTNILK